MPPEPVKFGGAPPERPFAFDGIIGRRIIRFIHRFAPIILARKTGGEINLPANVHLAHRSNMEMDAQVVVTLGNGHAALVSLGDHIGEQGMKTPLRFFTIPQIAKPAAGIQIPQRQGEKCDPLLAEGFGHPFDVLCQGVGLFLSRAGQWAIFLFLFLLTCSCYK